MMDIQHAVSLRVYSFTRIPWDHIKNSLKRQMADKLMDDIIDSGQHHVLKMDILTRNSYDHGNEYTEYCLKVRHSIAQEQKVTIASIEYEGKQWDRCCVYCGNALRLDERGGCKACGAPNGGYK